MCRAREGLVGGRSITVAHFGRNIVRGLVAHHGRAGGRCLVQVYHHRQLFVFDHHRFGGVARLLQRVGQHHRQCLTDVAHPLECQWSAQWGHAGRAAGTLERRRAWDRFDPSSHQIRTVKNGNNPWHGQSGGFVNAQNAGVWINRPDKTQTQVVVVLSVIRDVVSESPLTLEQFVVFYAEHRVATAKSGVIAIHVAIPRLIEVCAGKP